MKYFLRYWLDDWTQGEESFDSLEAALAFIEDRLKYHDHLEDYDLIRGETVELEAYVTAVKVREKPNDSGDRQRNHGCRL